MGNDNTTGGGYFVDSYSIPFVVGFLIRFDVLFSGITIGYYLPPLTLHLEEMILW